MSSANLAVPPRYQPAAWRCTRCRLEIGYYQPISVVLPGSCLHNWESIPAGVAAPNPRKVYNTGRYGYLVDNWDSLKPDFSSG
jgi:hypothetical protein